MGNGMLSQEEIDALLKGTMDMEPEAPGAWDAGSDANLDHSLEDMEKDAIGEIANISMGTAATTLSLLLGKKVEITTPQVELVTSSMIRSEYPVPSVICDVRYKAGIEGSNLLILSQRDATVIVDLMMGGDGKNPSPELTELQISGVSEAMNQMMGSAATSMSTMFNSMVDITPPSLVLHDLSMEKDVIGDFLLTDGPHVRVSFRMVVEDVIDSVLIQVIPLNMAKGMVGKLMSAMQTTAAAAPASPAAPAPAAPAPKPAPPAPEPAPYNSYQNQAPAMGSPIPQPANPYVPPSQPAYEAPPYAAQHTPVQPVQFAPLKPGQVPEHPDNLSLILDVPLQISVELGRSRKTIKEILEMGPGSVVELDRLAGEPVDMIVNGKLIAKCEVVVVNETFGIRITDIVHPLERMNSFN